MPKTTYVIKSDTPNSLFMLRGIAKKTHLNRAGKRANKPRKKGTDMGDEDKKDEKQPEAGAEGAEGGKDEGNESKAAEGAEGGSNGGEESGDVLDKHGKPGINAEKYKRDMEAKDAEIEKLQAQIAEAAKTEEGKAELQKQIDELKASQADERVNHKLEMAGCVNTKAAKALLDDYDGDVAKLKNECPICSKVRRSPAPQAVSLQERQKAV